MRLPAALALAFAAGKLMTKIKMPALLGWLIVGILFAPRCWAASAGCSQRRPVAVIAAKKALSLPERSKKTAKLHRKITTLECIALCCYPTRRELLRLYSRNVRTAAAAMSTAVMTANAAECEEGTRISTAEIPGMIEI